MMTAFFFWFGWKINDGDNSSTRVLCFSLFLSFYRRKLPGGYVSNTRKKPLGVRASHFLYIAMIPLTLASPPTYSTTKTCT